MFWFISNKSIKSKVISQITAQIVIALFLIIVMVIFIVDKQLSEQTQALLVNKTHALNERLEQRLSFLIENTELLTKNELMINSLTDSEGRSTYLSPLIENFMEGRGVISLDVVGYDGKPIFQTQKSIPTYNESLMLRTALVFSQVSYDIRESDNQLVVISPIKYYSTTQGAVIVVFNLAVFVDNNLPEDKNAFVKLIKNNQTIYSYNFDPTVSYTTFNNHSDSMSRFEQLGVSVEIGLPENEYRAPIKNATIMLIILGLFFIIISIYISSKIASNITAPIIELYRRVKASDNKLNMPCSPLGSNDELEDLAIAFDERTYSLQYQARHDPLTSLPNRILFLDRLNQAIQIAQRSQTKVVVLFIDLDNFKEVNDSFGHDVGDELLQVVAKRMLSNLRASDSIARFGGDEFTILLDGIEHEEEIIIILQKIMQVFTEQFILENHQFFISCSMGIAIGPDNGVSPEDLLKHADSAMYKAKKQGRNNYQFYTYDMTEKAHERIALETKLKQAIKNKEFEVHYQPQVDIRTKQITGMEALIRWNQPDDGQIPPDKFIPLAEETGCIIEIDHWVMHNAMQQFMVWKNDGLVTGVLSLNLSTVMLDRDDFISIVKHAMSETKMSPKTLMFEVTETQIMRNPEHVIKLLKHIKQLGVRLAIDDFGTGHSSLSYLKRLPVDKIKIDREFIRDIPNDLDDIKLTRAIIALSQSLQLDVIAEGVETSEQADFLLQHNCFEAQGYFYFKPLSANKITSILRKQQGLSY